MCYYRLFIFRGCGHSASSFKPIRPCASARQIFQSKTQEAPRKQTNQGIPTAAQSLADAHTADTTLDDVECEHIRDAYSTTPPAENTPFAHIPTSWPLPEACRPATPTLYGDGDPEAAACEIFLTHPFQTLNIDSSCAVCQRQRAALLADLETQTARVRFEDWRWKVKYSSPTPEARYTEWGDVGTAMGSWVKDWNVKGSEVLRI
ncbi:hypothetical protein N0V90_006284 [Kalmusia sp. IMI 367209]|nr:hypothetical protein N0V90_006284 [Kalmusia sp. IMI 367209]